MNEKIMKQEAHYDWLKDEVHCLYGEKKELQERIDKAIEYIENKTDKVKYKEIGITEKRLYLIHNQVDYLLDILKGSDKNVD
jgi:hypothetical protein